MILDKRSASTFPLVLHFKRTVHPQVTLEDVSALLPLGKVGWCAGECCETGQKMESFARRELQLGKYPWWFG